MVSVIPMCDWFLLEECNKLYVMLFSPRLNEKESFVDSKKKNTESGTLKLKGEGLCGFVLD